MSTEKGVSYSMSCRHLSLRVTQLKNISFLKITREKNRHVAGNKLETHLSIARHQEDFYENLALDHVVEDSLTLQQT